MRLRPQGFLRAESGVAALEFALVAPFLVMVLVGIVDLTLVIHGRMELAQVLTSGAQYAFMQGQSGTETGSALTTDVQNFVTTTTPETLSNLTVSYNGGNSVSSCYCVAGASPTYTAATCQSVCSDGSTAGKFVTISATISPTPFFAVDQYLMPGLVSSSVTVRLQ